MRTEHMTVILGLRPGGICCVLAQEQPLRTLSGRQEGRKAGIVRGRNGPVEAPPRIFVCWNEL